MDKNPVIRKGIEKLGGPVSAAKALDEPNYQTLQQWIRQGQVAAAACVKFEALTGIPRNKLRKDWKRYWPEFSERAA